MRKICCGLIVLGVLFCAATPVKAEVSVSIGIGLPHVSIGINVPFYPRLVPVPGYPVYYAPRIYANYFFYDGMYWVYQNDNWYASDWFDGPWWLVEPEFVPLFILRIPVYYYMRPPLHFHRWHAHRPPRWGERWGRDWEDRHRGWDRWERDAVPPPAPLPTYQQQYSGSRYPRFEEQEGLRDRHYRYQPRDVTVREHVQPRLERRAPPSAQQGRREEPPAKSERLPEPRYSRPVEKDRLPAPGLPPRKGIENRQRPDAGQPPGRYREPEARERRLPSGDAQREREQVAPRTRDRDQGVRDRGGESPRKYTPPQEPPRYRGSEKQDRRPPSGDKQWEREQFEQRSRGEDRGDREREGNGGSR